MLFVWLVTSRQTLQRADHSIHETGDFAEQPLGYQIFSGPDEVYDEWDNGRGYIYSGPDGTFSYDPF